MASIAGKTIEWVEESPTNPEYGYRERGRLRFHFTDGSVADVVGHSYEEVDLSVEAVDRDRVRASLRAAAGRRERQRLDRLRREELASVSDEERARRREARRAKMSPFARMFEDEIASMAHSWVADMNRMGFGSTITIPVAPSDRRGRARRS